MIQLATERGKQTIHQPRKEIRLVAVHRPKLLGTIYLGKWEELAFQKRLEKQQVGGDIVPTHFSNESANAIAAFGSFQIYGYPATTTGNLIIVSTGYPSNIENTDAISDNVGNFYNLCTDPVSGTTASVVSNSGGSTVQLFQAVTAKKGSAQLTIHINGTVFGSSNVYVVELTNADPISPLVKLVALNEQPSTANISGPAITISPQVVNGICISSIGTSNGTSSGAGSGFTYVNQSIQYNQATKSGGTFTPTWVNTAGGWCGCTAVWTGAVEDNSTTPVTQLSIGA